VGENTGILAAWQPFPRGEPAPGAGLVISEGMAYVSKVVFPGDSRPDKRVLMLFAEGKREMRIPVIVMGAAGRMGSTLVRLVREAPDLALAGMTERPECLETVARQGRASSEVAELLVGIPKALILDFTTPEASLATARKAVEHGACHVIGTTGLSEAQKEELARLAEKTPLFWSPNMSVGVAALLSILPELVRLLGDGYDVEVQEIHHSRKKDSPSGTALRLAEVLAKARGWKLEETARYHRQGLTGERPREEIGMQTLRGGDVVGVHTVYFLGTGERLELTHQAQSRENFAFGALRAARWLYARAPGRLYTIQDVLFHEDSPPAK
jgi:4-hydroxy-tetrahydrodipicolinate reductase